MQKTSPRYFDFQLTEQQQKAFNSLQLFVKDDNYKAFVLKGYAGTGKTSLIGGLIKWMNKEKLGYVLLASTGRAAKILSNLTKNEARTVHSHIYTFADLSENLEDLKNQQNDISVDDKGQINLLFELKPIQSNKQNIYIVDEASMLNDTLETGGSFAKFGSGRLLFDLMKFDIKGKYLFVGDPCQLPPINQTFSPALSVDYLNGNYDISAREFELTDIVRQTRNNGIIEASFKLRNLYLSNPEVKFANMPVKGFNNIQLHSSHVNLLQHYIEKIKLNGFDYATLLCQTNRHCTDLNKIIRSSLNRNSDRIEKGDLIMVTQNNYISRLVNGDLAIIKQTGSREYRCGLTFLQIQVEELVSNNEYNLLLVEDILYSNATNLNSKQHKDLMIDYYVRMKAHGLSQKHKEFKEKMLSDPYLNALKAVYGYALTCHKCQGGEWNEVFLYLDNKIHGLPKPGIYQWWYTAVTRAKEELHLVEDWYIK